MHVQVHVDKLVQLVNQEHKENVDKQDLQLFKDSPIKLVHRVNQKHQTNQMLQDPLEEMEMIDNWVKEEYTWSTRCSRSTWSKKK